MPFIKTSFADSIGTVAFDPDAKRNALNAGLIAETIAASTTSGQALPRRRAAAQRDRRQGLVGRARYRRGAA